MACNDSHHVAVDMGVESWADSIAQKSELASERAATGYRLATSVSRIWWTYWTGLPALVQGVAVLPANDQQQPFAKARIRKPSFSNASTPSYAPSAAGTARWPISPALRCVPDTPPSLFSWTYEARWAQRESVSSGAVLFWLRFDRNTWLPSITVDETFTLAPGLSYPVPGIDQLSHLQDEIADDVRDIMGEWPGEATSGGGKIGNFRDVRVSVLQVQVPSNFSWGIDSTLECQQPHTVDQDSPVLPMSI